MPTQYAGAWRSRQLFVNEAAPLAPGVDSAHSYPDAPDNGSRPPSGAPPLDPSPMFLTEGPDTYQASLDQPGQVLDQEPITHDAGDMNGLPSPAHMLDYGAADRVVQAPRFLRQHDEKYQTPRFETGPTQGDLTVAALRGDNSLKENNDDDNYPETGYRVGYTVWRRMDRQMAPGGLAGGWRTHMERWLQVGTAAAPNASPAPRNPNRYQSPYGLLARATPRMLQLPILRRNPPDFSESALSDGSGQPDAFLDWVM